MNLKNFELNNGGMNGQEFFKSQKLSQGGSGMNSQGSPMGSGEKSLKVKND